MNSSSTIFCFTRSIPASHVYNKILPTTCSQKRRASVITSSGGDNVDKESSAAETPPVQIKFRRGSRRKSRQQGMVMEEDYYRKREGEEQVAEKKKGWEEMSVTEKAVELYVGEKGLLFWINKFAYASIFIVIGAWILFRFVGPALNLYQLDTPVLSPSRVFQ